jgi:DNA-binding transcriptional ArsR family regulator
MQEFSTADKLQQKELQIQDSPQGRSSNLNLCILQHIQSGISPATICKLEGISESALQYHLNELKNAGAIRKIGYGTWEVSDTAFFDLKRTMKEVQTTSNNFKISTKKEVQKHDRTSNSNLCIGTNSKYRTADKLQQKELQIQDRTSNLKLCILQHIYSGIRPAAICKLEGFSESALQYHLNKLKHAGAIRKIAYGTWEVSDTAFFDLKRTSKSSQVAYTKVPQNLNFLTQDSVRGHGFVFTLKLDKGLRNWGRREEFLEKNNIKYIKLKIPKGGQRIIFKGRKIWLTNKSVIVYEKSSYFSETAKGAKDYAIYKFISLIKSLERYLQADFTIKAGQHYKFKVSRQHYALVRNALALQYDKEGKKLQVYTANGLWFLIDNSFNLHEAETVHAETADDDNHKVQSFFNSLKDYPLTTDFILKAMNGIQDNQLLFARNHETHIQAIEDLGQGVRTLTDLLKRLDIQLKN